MNSSSTYTYSTTLPISVAPNYSGEIYTGVAPINYTSYSIVQSQDDIIKDLGLDEDYFSDSEAQESTEEACNECRYCSKYKKLNLPTLIMSLNVCSKSTPMKPTKANNTCNDFSLDQKYIAFKEV